jgi:endonuclease YncB( thermonuclease family)
MSDWLSVGLLAGALLLFVLSTRQFVLWQRCVILLAAIGALTWAGIIIAPSDGHYLFPLGQDAWIHRGDPANSAAALAFGANRLTVGHHVVPLLDLFFLISALLGAVAIFALTPGESVERFVRPLLISLMGAVAGAAAALALVATGFGGAVEPRIYVARGASVEVHDGDTLIFGDTSLRLYGVEAPELDQACLGGGEVCGELSKGFLQSIIAGELVVCRVHERASRHVAKTFGRPLARCRTQASGLDVGQRMIESGHAAIYPQSHPPEYENLSIDRNSNEFIDSCWEMPRHSRGDTSPPPRVGACD